MIMRSVSTIGDFQTRAWERAGRSTAMPPGRDAREEPDAKVGIVAKLMAEDAEGTWGITKSAGGLDRGKLLDEEGTQGFVLPLEMRFGVSVAARKGATFAGQGGPALGPQ